MVSVESLMACAASGVYPSGRFRNLVIAALRPELAVQAWKSYVEETGANTPDIGETRLYPIVASNLKQVGETRLDQRLLKARRTAIAQSEVIIQAADYLNDLFASKGVDLVFVKGLALLITEYREAALRTFSDIDCCIRVEDVQKVVRIAKEENWTNFTNFVPNFQEGFEAHQEMTFRLTSGVSFDVHWVPRRVFSYQPQLVANFFETTEIVEWRASHWRVPSATWRLIETIEHGNVANGVVPIRWVPDAVRLLENLENEIDWDFIEKCIGDVQLQLVFLTGLTGISQVSASISPVKIARFDQPLGRLQVLEYKSRIQLRKSHWDRLKCDFAHYFLRKQGSLLHKCLGFPQFLIRGAGRSKGLLELLSRVWKERKFR